MDEHLETANRKKTAVQEFVDSDREAMKLFQQERAILEATELICEIMAAEQVSRTELAKRLGKTKGYVTQLLDGQANMTIRTMSDIFLVLGRTLHVQEGNLEAGYSNIGQCPED